jgi:hypothetical protein
MPLPQSRYSFGMLSLVSPPDWAAHLALSARDRDILAWTRRLYDGGDFDQTVRALSDATKIVIPAGRIYVLGSRDGAPIYGSLVSRVGIVETQSGIRVVRSPR